MAKEALVIGAAGYDFNAAKGQILAEAEGKNFQRDAAAPECSRQICLIYSASSMPMYNGKLSGRRNECNSDE
jgi:hypothetical protein